MALKVYNSKMEFPPFNRTQNLRAVLTLFDNSVWAFHKTPNQETAQDVYLASNRWMHVYEQILKTSGAIPQELKQKYLNDSKIARQDLKMITNTDTHIQSYHRLMQLHADKVRGMRDH